MAGSRAILNRKLLSSRNLDPQLGEQEAIAIQPTDPQVIYPPVYDPGYIWGPPAYGAYPDLFYPD